MVCLQWEDWIQAAYLDFISNKIFLPTDISFLFPRNMTLFSMPFSVCMPTPVVLSMKIFGKLCLTVFSCFSDFFKRCSEPGNIRCSLEYLGDLKIQPFLRKQWSVFITSHTVNLLSRCVGTGVSPGHSSLGTSWQVKERRALWWWPDGWWIVNSRDLLREIYWSGLGLCFRPEIRPSLIFYYLILVFQRNSFK